tara:strand:- start:465 stop:1856 length:1392 start_codon:yes stop_codon:yes gene_type:complete
MRRMKKTHLSLTLLGFITALITSCGNNQGETNITPERIEFPIIEYTINSSSDTTIFGPQGTRIFIGAETFQFADGNTATDPIKIELKEFYELSDIVLADLSTVSDNKILETAGMLHILASSNGKDLEIKSNKRIVVHLPKKENYYGKMNLFYADQASSTDSSVNNWSVDTVNLVKRTLKLGSFGWWYPEYGDSTGYDFTPKNYVDTGYYWNPLDFYIESYDFSENTKREIETTLNRNDYANFESWNDYGVECEMGITTNGYIKNAKVNTKVSNETKKEIISFLKNLPQLEPGTNKHGDIIERRGLLFIQGGNIIPLYKTDEEYLKSFDSKYSEYENVPIKNMDDAEMNYYVFSVSKLGWINCDRFIDSEETVDLVAQIPVDSKTKLKLAFSDIDGVLKANIIDNKYVFNKVPIGRKVTIIGIKNDNGQFMTAFEERTITNDPIEGLNFTPTTLADLRKELEKI